MKRFKIITILLFSLLVTVGCDDNFAELNTDPNNPTAVPSDLLIPGVARGAQNQSYSTFVGGDMGACWSQQFAKVQYNDEERYLPRQGVISGVWDTYYAVVISDANSMYNIAVTEENKNMQGVALTLQAYGYAFLTDAYGDIPFSEAIKAEEGNIAPAYDKQEDVYTGILSMLDDAIALLGTSGTINSTNDVIYGGNAGLWKKFASSLKFRVLMRASGKMDVSSQLQALVNSGKLFASNDEDAKLAYLSAQPSANPLYESIVYGTRGEWKINEVVVTLLESSSDPRLSVYAQKNADGDYRGKPSGYTDLPSDDWGYENVSALGEFYLRPELPGFFVSYPEIKFLMAEAATKGYISGGASMANTNYIEGIRASFEYNEVPAGAIANYLAERVLAADTPTALEQIATQNYLALFSQGVESWTEWRRTGIPALTPAIEGDLNEIPSRYNYPTTENSINKTNYDAAVASQGPDLLTTPIWWMN
jgi:hypothetical protein